MAEAVTESSKRGPREGGLLAGWRAVTSQDLPRAEELFAAADVDLVHRRVLGKHYFFSRSPSHVEHVFISAHDRYRKSTHYRLLAAVTGEGLLTNEGESWARQRRLIQPVFTRRNLDRLVPHMAAATQEFLDRWPETSPTGPVDVASAMTEVTLDVVGRALFGATLADTAARLRPAVAVGLETALAGARLQTLLALPRWLVDAIGAAIFYVPLLPPPLGRIRHAMRTIDATVRAIIDERVATGSGTEDDLLGQLLGARGEDGEAMARQQVRDEIVTLMLAGHETTANGLAWLWYVLAEQPEARRRLYAEIDEALSGRVPTAPDVDRLSWTTACFQETLRLYPPAWVLEREARVDDEFGGEHIPAGSTVIFPVHLIHRDPRSWPEPEAFDPRRFLPGAPPPPRGAYLPFGAGRRSCIGAMFALIEGTLIAAMVAQRYELDLPPEAHVVPSATVTLRPRGGLPMTVRKLRSIPSPPTNSQGRSSAGTPRRGIQKTV
jgi:cytochrome P450